MEKPLVSILIPLYNHEKYISDLILSILEQTYDNIEVVICDDCSADSSFQVAKQYEEKLLDRFEHVEILKNKSNMGIVKNVNKMIGMSKGEIVKTIDSDDWLYPSTIEKVVNVFLQNEKLGMVLTNLAIINENDNYKETVNKVPDNKGYKMPDISGDWFQRLLYGNNVIWETAFIRRTLFDLLGAFDESIYFHDWDWNLRVAKNDVAVELLKDSYIAYRLVSDSMSHDTSYSKRKKMLMGDLETLEKYKEDVNKKIFQKALKKRCNVMLYLAAYQGIGVKETINLLNEAYKVFDEKVEYSILIYY